MKFIRFADTLLNLEQVVCFSYYRQRLTADLVNSKDPVYEVYDSPKEAHDRFQEIVDIINSNAKPDPKSNGVVMTVADAIDAGVFLLNKNVRVKGVVRGLNVDTKQCMVMIGVRQGWLDGWEEIEVLG